MLEWIPLTESSQLNQIDELSETQPILIFKHSTTCNISAMSKYRLESEWDLAVPAFYLDLKRYRSISDEISDRYHVYHESPQILLIHKGISQYDASHFDITVQELHEVIPLILEK